MQLAWPFALIGAAVGAQLPAAVRLERDPGAGAGAVRRAGLERARSRARLAGGADVAARRHGDGRDASAGASRASTAPPSAWSPASASACWRCRRWCSSPTARGARCGCRAARSSGERSVARVWLSGAVDELAGGADGAGASPIRGRDRRRRRWRSCARWRRCCWRSPTRRSGWRSRRSPEPTAARASVGEPVSRQRGAASRRHRRAKVGRARGRISAI